MGTACRKIFYAMRRKIVAKPEFPYIINSVLTKPCALVAELVDALDSGSSGGSPVKVRVLSGAPNKALQVNCLQSLTGFWAEMNKWHGMIPERMAVSCGQFLPHLG